MSHMDQERRFGRTGDPSGHEQAADIWANPCLVAMGLTRLLAVRSSATNFPIKRLGADGQLGGEADPLSFRRQLPVPFDPCVKAGSDCFHGQDFDLEARMLQFVSKGFHEYQSNARVR